MNMWFAIFSIVAIIVIADTIQKVAKAKATKKNDDAELESTLSRINELEDRIRVLERIVTEDKHDLRREINKL